MRGESYERVINNEKINGTNRSVIDDHVRREEKDGKRKEKSHSLNDKISQKICTRNKVGKNF